LYKALVASNLIIEDNNLHPDTPPNNNTTSISIMSTKVGKKKKRRDSSGEDDDDSDSQPKRKQKSSTRQKKPKEQKPVIYCICRQPDDGERPMIGCDGCEEWFHFECLNMNKADQQRVQALERYYCPTCEKTGETGKQREGGYDDGDDDNQEGEGENQDAAAGGAAATSTVASNIPQPDCCVPRPVDSTAAYLGVCATIACGKPATLGPCPSCAQQHIKEQYWCCQTCFQANWVYHYANNCGMPKPAA